MALPTGLSAVQVTCGPYIDTKGAPYSGTITFQPSTPVVWQATGSVLLNGAVKVTLDAAGAGQITLPATDATGLSVTGFTYTVTFALKSTSGDKATILPALIQLPKATSTVDLDLLVGVETASGVEVATPAVVSIGGLSGAVQVSDLKTILGLGSAAYLASTAFDATGAATAAQAAAVASSAQRAANLSDLASAATARTNLGLGTAATQSAGSFDPVGAATAAQQAAIALAIFLGS